MAPIVRISDLKKTYKGGFEALKGVSLDIEEGEILALLGPNGAGKTTLISIVCGISTQTAGTVTVAGHDTTREFRAARSLIGLVPQELNLEIFETVWNTVRFSRGLFGKPHDPAVLEDVLRKLSLWDKKDARIRELSGGMKRRVLIAKALAHEPRILFLDEPTAGVDVELRKGMWEVVRGLRAQGVTIILTTHYIEEAEAMADRVAVIDKGRLLLVDDKAELMKRMGKKRLKVWLDQPIEALPPELEAFDLTLEAGGQALVYTYDTGARHTGITDLLAAIRDAGLRLADLETEKSSLEEIFISLLAEEEKGEPA